MKDKELKSVKDIMFDYFQDSVDPEAMTRCAKLIEEARTPSLKAEFPKSCPDCGGETMHWVKCPRKGEKIQSPSLDGVEGAIYNDISTAQGSIHLTIKEKWEIAASIVKTLSPYLKDKVEWDEEAVKEYLKKHRESCHLTYNGGHNEKETNSAFHHGIDTVHNCFDNYLFKALTQHFRPPMIIWPEELGKHPIEGTVNPKEIAIYNDGANQMLANCKAAHPVKEIEWPLKMYYGGPTLSGSEEYNKGANEMLAKCKEAERKSRE